MDGKSFLFRTAYFISAYLPLFIFTGVYLAYKKGFYFCILPILAFLFTVAFISSLIKQLYNFPKIEIVVAKVENANSAYMFYLASYLPIILEFVIPSVIGFIFLMFIYGILFLLYLTTGWKLINPILLMLGYKVALIEDKTYREYLVYYMEKLDKKIEGRLIDPTILIVSKE